MWTSWVLWTNFCYPSRGKIPHLKVRFCSSKPKRILASTVFGRWATPTFFGFLTLSLNHRKPLAWEWPWDSFFEIMAGDGCSLNLLCLLSISRFSRFFCFLSFSKILSLMSLKSYDDKSLKGFFYPSVKNFIARSLIFDWKIQKVLFISFYRYLLDCN